MKQDRPPKQHSGRDKLADAMKILAKYQAKIAQGGGLPHKRMQLKAKIGRLKDRIAEMEAGK